MTTPPNRIALIPAIIIGLPETFPVTTGAKVPASADGWEYGDAAGIFVVSDVPFYWTLADTDGDGATQLGSDSSRGWCPAGAYTFSFFAETRKLYLMANGNGKMTVYRVDAFEGV